MAVAESHLAPVPAQDDSMLSFVMSADEAARRVAELQAFVQRCMVKDVDYGRIPGTPKPTLLKPGAEKLSEIYGLAPTVEVTNRVEEWEKGLFHYEVRVRLVSRRTGTVVAEGIGSANNRESRYRRKDGSPMDPYALVNTILKMAKKRALVDAALSATRSSGIFTQDVEDLHDDEQPRERATAPRQQAQAQGSDGRATEKQRKTIYAISKSLGVQPEAMREGMARLYGTEDSRELTARQASDLIDRLKAIESGAKTEPEALGLLDEPEGE